MMIGFMIQTFRCKSCFKTSSSLISKYLKWTELFSLPYVMWHTKVHKDFIITEQTPAWAFLWLKAHFTFTFKILLRHYYDKQFAHCRYMSILHPLSPRMTTRQCLLAILSMWVLALVVCSPDMAIIRYEADIDIGAQCFVCK